MATLIYAHQHQWGLFDRPYPQERLFGSRLALAAEGGRRRTKTTTTASNAAELAINNREEKWRRGYHSRFGDDDEDKHRHVHDEDKHNHVYDEQESVVNRGVASRGYLRGQSVIVGGRDRSHANRIGIGFRRSASFHAAELFEELAGMGTETTL